MKIIVVELICLVLLSGCSLSVASKPILQQGLIIDKRHILESTGTKEDWVLDIERVYDVKHNKLVSQPVTIDRDTVHVSKGKYESYEVGDIWIRELHDQTPNEDTQ